jgi:hypothetical protein
VSYLHSWKDFDKKQGGVYLYPEGLGQEKKVIKPEANIGFLLDGTKTAHGTQTFLPKEVTGMKDDEDYTIAFNGKNWEVRDSNDILFKTYIEDNIRISVVWRQRCFKDKQQQTLFHESHTSQQLKV